MKIIRPVDVDDSVFQSSDVPEADYAAWAGGTTYADEDRVIVTTGYHKIYESQQAANTGNDPTTDDGTWWVEVSSTNRWKMFNAIVQEQTVQASEINTVLQSSTVVNSVALINLDATTVQITVTDSVEGLVYDETYTMTSYSGIQDWYAYFFEPIIRDTQLAVTDLPPYANADIGVTISSSGDAKCGALVIGQFAVLGLSQHGVSLSIVDYSTKTTDAAGNVTIIDGAYSDKMEVDVVLDTAQIGQVKRTLTSLRTNPSVWVAQDNQSDLVIYGYYREFDIILSLCPRVSLHL